MHPILKNTLAVLFGLVAGSAVNMALIMISGSIVPPPEGADLTTTEGLQAAMKLMEPKHFVMPFLAHALGTLAGSYVAARLAANHHLFFAFVIGGASFLGGLMMVMQLPSPMWFNITDLALAYFPMSWLGHKIASK